MKEGLKVAAAALALGTATPEIAKANDQGEALNIPVSNEEGGTSVNTSVTLTSDFTNPANTIVQEGPGIKTFTGIDTDSFNGGLILNVPFENTRIERAVLTGCAETEGAIGADLCADGVFTFDKEDSDYYTAYAIKNFDLPLSPTLTVGYDNYDSFWAEASASRTWEAPFGTEVSLSGTIGSYGMEVKKEDTYGYGSLEMSRDLGKATITAGVDTSNAFTGEPDTTFRVGVSRSFELK